MPAIGHLNSWVFNNNDPSVLSGIDVTAPSILTATVGDGVDNIIVLQYNEVLDSGSVPAAVDFSLSGTTETVASVAISYYSVSLTLTGNILNTETILVSYTAAANPIRDIAENEAANLVNQAVANNVGVPMRDSYGDSVPDSYGNTIIMPH